MKFAGFDLDRDVLVVAEIGNNHEGNFEVAQRMLASAAECGAHAVKFQTFIADRFVSAADPERLARLRRFQLSFEQFAALARQARDLGVTFFSTPLDLESARFLADIQPLFKIASGDNNFFPLIDLVAGFGKPLIVSTGFAELGLVESVHARVRRAWQGRGADPGLAFMHCVSCYPVTPEHANLATIGTLHARFPDCAIGYSDHTIGIQAAGYAVAAGARIIEKHFTLDKNYSSFRDHQLSADPADLRQLVASVREINALMGHGRREPQPCETASVSAVRRSIATARDLPAGTTLADGDFLWLRPGTGFAPGEEATLVGRVTARAIPRGTLITPQDLAPVAGDR
jgi:N,N'-diacetyllegionaminate synthase